MGARDEVESLNSEFSKGVANQDMDGVLDLYAPDARLLPPGAPMMRGEDEIRAYFQSMLDMGVRACELDSVAVEEGGDLVVDIGRYRLTIEPPGAESMIDDGKYIVVLKRQTDGTLRIVHDTFNSDQEPPA